MQMLNGMHNAQTYTEGIAMNLKRNLICQKLSLLQKYKRLPQTFLTFWLYVGIYATYLLQDICGWVALMQAIKKDTSNKLNNIA